MATLTQPDLQSLITEARALLNQKDPMNSTWQDDDLALWCNEGVRRYYMEAVMDNEGLFTTSADLNITANSDQVTLPTDFFEAKNIWKKVTNGYILLPYNNNLTEGYSTQGGTGTQTYTPSYYFQNNTLIIRPTPEFSETAGLKIEYIKYPTFLVNAGDSLDTGVSPVFRDLIINFIVYKAKYQQSLVTGSDVHTNAQNELNSIYGQVKEAMKRRSKNPTYIIPFNPES